MKVFISQPMRGLSDEEIIRQRDAAYRYIQRRHGDEVTILESFVPGLRTTKPLAALIDSLDFLALADVAYFLPGWEDASGCRVEHYVCTEYGIPTADIPEYWFK